jgi:hypothetical protein
MLPAAHTVGLMTQHCDYTIENGKWKGWETTNAVKSDCISSIHAEASNSIVKYTWEVIHWD